MTFEDAAISGGTSQRPGYQALLVAARRNDIDVIVAEDASRLWRNMAEQAPRLAELRDIGIHVVTQDLDTRQESSEWMGAILGTAASAYRSEIARRTRRGLEGRAIKAMPTGGKAYGYRTEDGRRVVVPDHAAIVREIFELFGKGESAQALAVDLNARGIPSPGVAWNRSTRRRGGWHPSAIAGDRKRGVGIVNNDLYRGLVVWNRCRWVRLASDSKKRRVVINPESAWVKHPDESLRIVSDALWNAVKRRQLEQHERVGKRVSAGLAKLSAKSTGRVGHHLFSGLLKCSACGSTYTLADKRFYACAGYINGRVCSNGRRVRRDRLEDALLKGIREGLSDPAMLRDMERRIRQALRSRKPDDSNARIGKLEAEVARLVDAIASGLMSPALRQRLQQAEADLERARNAPTPANVENLLPRLSDMVRRKVRELGTLSADEPVRARAALKQALETDLITLRPSEEGRGVIASFGLDPVGAATGTMPEIMVAGACFGNFRRVVCIA